MSARWKRERDRCAEIYGVPGTSVVVAGRSWIYWQEGAVVDAYAQTDEDVLPCRDADLVAYMGVPQHGESVADAVIRIAGRYGGLA